MNVRLTQVFTLHAPLSHKGESIGTISYLVQEPIVQADGAIEEVFCYGGNSWRGQLRDLAASYLLDALGIGGAGGRIGLDAFHLLYAGGSIGGTQSVDLAQARAYRALLPSVALWGGGVGSQILPGKLRVNNHYPLCREMPPLPLPPHLAARRDRVSYRQLTTEKSFSRMDDSKDERKRTYLAPPAPTQTMVPGATRDRGTPQGHAEKAGVSQQMRTTSELLIAGAQLYGSVEVLDCTAIELGCLVAAYHAFSRSPHIGGEVGKGHGLVRLDVDLLDLDTGEVEDGFVIADGACLLSTRATAAKARYDQHLRGLYDAMLGEQGSEARALLGATAG